MERSDYSLGDWHRIVFGVAPADFVLEVLYRTLFIYVMLVVVMRLLGKRMSGQVTILDMSIMIMLGAIVAPPAEQPDRGLLQGMLILVLVLLLHWGTSWWGVKKLKIERVLHGDLAILVKDGLLQVPVMKKTRVSREQLYAVLRGMQVFNLGQVDRVYLEAYGHFTVYKAASERPGLSTLPRQDAALEALFERRETALKACRNCGLTVQPVQAACPACGHADWDDAVISNQNK